MITLILFSLLLWVLFIVFSNTKKYTGKQYNPLIQAGAHLYRFIFGIFDIALNLTYGTLFFVDLPRELTLTSRMKRLLHDDPQYDWRWEIADFVCRRMVEPWDFNHCGLNNNKQSR